MPERDRVQIDRRELHEAKLIRDCFPGPTSVVTVLTPTGERELRAALEVAG